MMIIREVSHAKALGTFLRHDSKLHDDDLLRSNGGLFVFNCNYAVDKLNISIFFYYELLLWWSELRDLVDGVMVMA